VTFFSAWVYNYLFAALKPRTKDSKVIKFYKVLRITMLLKEMKALVQEGDGEAFIERSLSSEKERKKEEAEEKQKKIKKA
jgi:hypothetical protein